MHLSEKPHTLVLIFAHSSKKEAALKGIAYGEELFDALTEQTIQTVRKTGLPYIHLDETTQIGNSFGERFTNAIQTLFEQGYERIITIGNDTPGLKASHLHKAKKQLDTGNFVLGRASDGGFYLMGLLKAHFDKNAFKKFSWQTSKVSHELLTLLSRRSVDVFRLETLFDIDTTSDLQHCLHSPEVWSAALLGIVVFILGKKSPDYYYGSNTISSFYPIAFYNKGSPFSC